MKTLLAFVTFTLVALTATARAQSYTFTQAASTYSPGGVAADSAGNIYFTSYYYHTVSKLAPNGTVTTLAGSSYSSGAVDATGASARFNYPRGLAVDSTGNLYVADSNNHTIRKISPTGIVSILAGEPLKPGVVDATGTAARFNTPYGVALDSAGNLYVADSANYAIRKITPAGVVTTFAGSSIPGTADGTGTAARFNYPHGIASDSAGNLYVADTGNHAIRKISPAGVVTTLAGSIGNAGSADGTGIAAQFFTPTTVAVDSTGTLFVTDSSNYTIRKVTSTGVVTTVGGTPGATGDTSGLGGAARFYSPRGVAVDSSGNLFVGDYYALKLGVSSSQLSFTVQPLSTSVAAGAALALTSTATGTAPITYQWSKNGAIIPGATSSALSFSSIQSTDAGTYLVSATNSVGTIVSSNATLTVLPSLANNNFADAEALAPVGGVIPGRNTGATAEPGEPTHASPSATASSVWYRWTAPQTGSAVFTVSGSINPAQAAYTGTTLANLVPVARTPGTRLTFDAVAGTTYSIVVGSSDSSRGNFTLTWWTIPNDHFANAQTISGSSGTVTGRNDGATTESAEPTAPYRVVNSVWYRWTPTQSGTVLFEVPTTHDSVVFTGSSLSSLLGVSPLAAQTVLSGSTYTNRRIFNVEAGTTYFIAVGGANSGSTFTATWSITTNPIINGVANSGSRTAAPGSSTSFFAPPYISSTWVTSQWFLNGTAIAGATDSTLTLTNIQPANAGVYSVRITNSTSSAEITVGTLTVLTPPANDNFADAASVSGLTGTINGTNVNATGETSEPIHWNLSGTASSVWYRWTAPATGLASIDTVGSSLDTILAVYSGSTLANLSRLTQDDDRGGNRTSLVSFSATAGTTYYLVVGSASSGSRGAFRLNWQLSAILAITTQPVAQTIAAGGSATLSVAASAANATYQWSRNGTAIPGATTSTLNLGSAALGSDASYTVTVTAAGVSVTSTPATIAVSSPLLTTFSVRHSRNDASSASLLNLLWGVAAGNGTMVAVGDRGLILTSADDGRTWVNRDSGTTGWLVSVTYGNGQFVIVGEGGVILTSTNGVAWTPVTGTATKERLNNILFADGKYVAVGEKGTVVTSVDGRTWTLRSTPVTTWLHGLTYNADIGHFAATGDAGVFLYSADAVTWNRLPIPGYTGELHHIVAVDSYSHFVTVGTQGKVISVRQNQLSLKDGTTLTTWSAEANSTNTTATLVGLVQGAGALFATSDDGQVITAANDRGPWFSLKSNVTGYLLSGIYHKNTLYIVGQQEAVIQSEPIYSTRLVNISTRGQVGAEGNVMISGFIVRGTTSKRVLVRAAGPALTGFGLSGALATPVLTVFDVAGKPIATNTGWNTPANGAAIAAAAVTVGAFPFATTSADSALLLTLDPGTYTAQIAGANGTTGLAIIEAYDLEPLSVETSRAINVSTRGVVGSGADKMIAGFVINGSAARRVLIRAVGPTLGDFGVPGTIAEPQLELYTGRGLLHASAGAWGLQSNADEIRSAAAVVNAFKLADGSKDSAMVVTLLPGAWTVQAGGPAGSTGVALIEVYVLP